MHNSWKDHLGGGDAGGTCGRAVDNFNSHFFTMLFLSEIALLKSDRIKQRLLNTALSLSKTDVSHPLSLPRPLFK